MTICDKKGQLCENWGMYHDRSFYVVSSLSAGRYLDWVDTRNIVIKTRNGKNTQEWWFDGKTNTIKSRKNNQSWDIASSGKAKNMQVYSTNSKWW